jgi:putative transposase
VPDTHRRLPHLESDFEWLFATWCLYGSLPKALYPPADSPNAGQAFTWMDKHLDTKADGPLHLRRPEIANAVIQTLHQGQALNYFDLAAWVIMPNHVHILINPHRPLPKILKSLKGHSAQLANKILNTTGQPFWQAETYEHWVRSKESYNRIHRYIENNPVKANLSPTPESYPYSSAHKPNQK